MTFIYIFASHIYWPVSKIFMRKKSAFLLFTSIWMLCVGAQEIPTDTIVVPDSVNVTDTLSTELPLSVATIEKPQYLRAVGEVMGVHIYINASPAM